MEKKKILPRRGSAGDVPLCGTGMNPHFLFDGAEKKTAVHGQKKRRLGGSNRHIRVDLAAERGRRGRCGSNRRLVPGAPDIGKTGIERRRKLRLPTCFRGDRRMGLRYFPRSPLRSALAGQLR